MGIRKGHRAVPVGLATAGLMAAGYGSAVGLAAHSSDGGDVPAARHASAQTGTAADDYESTLELGDAAGDQGLGVDLPPVGEAGHLIGRGDLLDEGGLIDRRE